MSYTKKLIKAELLLTVQQLVELIFLCKTIEFQPGQSSGYKVDKIYKS